MLTTYIVSIKSQLVELMDENMNLFNSMNEGLVVVAEQDHSLQFASKTAMNVLMRKKKQSTFKFNKGKYVWFYRRTGIFNPKAQIGIWFNRRTGIFDPNAQIWDLLEAKFLS